MSWTIEPNTLIQIASVAAAFAALWRKIGERDVQLGERLKTLTDTVGELKATVRDEARGVADLRLQLVKHSESLAQLHRDYSAVRADFDALEKRKGEDHSKIFEQLARIETQLKSIDSEIESLRDSRHSLGNAVQALKSQSLR